MGYEFLIIIENTNTIVVKIMERIYECYHCDNCPTEEDWNSNTHNSSIILPEAIDGGMFDCPNCDEVVCGEDLIEV